jgi:hypothetical protein
MWRSGNIHMSCVTPTAFKLDLIQTLEELSFDSGEGVILSSANVNTIHPSINLQRGMAALLWFVGSHTSFNQTLKDLLVMPHWQAGSLCADPDALWSARSWEE